MNISMPITSEELSALTRAAQSAGFCNLAEYLHHLMLQGVHAQLSRNL